MKYVTFFNKKYIYKGYYNGYNYESPNSCLKFRHFLDLKIMFEDHLIMSIVVPDYDDEEDVITASIQKLLDENQEEILLKLSSYIATLSYKVSLAQDEFGKLFPLL